MKKLLLFLILLIPFIINAEEISREKVVDVDLFALTDATLDNEGNYYVSGGVSDYSSITLARIEKHNSNKELLINKSLEGFSFCYSIDVVDNGSVYALCTKNVSFVGYNIEAYDRFNKYQQTYLVKLNSNLEIEFAKTYLNNYDISNTGQLFVKDNYVYFVEKEYVFDSYLREENYKRYFRYYEDAYLYKTDLNGEFISRTNVTNESIEKVFSYTYNPSETGGGTSIAAGPTRNTLVDDDSFYFIYNDTLYKYDFNCTKQWSTRIEEYINIKAVTKTNDGNLVVAGNYSDADIMKPYMAVIGENGQLIKRINIDTTGSATIFGIVNKDKGYYVVYNINSGTIDGINDVDTSYVAVKYDYDFNVKSVLELSNNYNMLIDETSGVYGIETQKKYYKYSSLFEDDTTVVEEPVEVEEEEKQNPETIDNILVFSLLTVISIVLLIILIRKRNIIRQY